MYSKPLENVLCKLNWVPETALGVGMLSKSSKVGFYNDGVLAEIKQKTHEIVKETTIMDKQTYWNYKHPRASAFFSNCKMSKKNFVKPYYHQSSVLDKIHDRKNGKFMSCTIQSPCASGKSLLSLLLISEIMEQCGSAAIYITNSSTAAQQVVDQALTYFEIAVDDILFIDSLDMTSLAPLIKPKHKIVIATYQMLTASNHSDEHSKFFECLFSLPLFGICILDEAHFAPAETYKKVFTIPCPVKIAVTGTVKREDNGISTLLQHTSSEPIVISRQELVKQKIIPDVQLVNFLIDEQQHCKRIWSTRKMEIFMHTLTYHVKNNDRIIIFFDTIHVLDTMHAYLYEYITKHFGNDILLPVLKGKTLTSERREILDQFRDKADQNKPVILVMSAVGDTAYNIPGNILYQMLCPDGSGARAAQRVGRVQRNHASHKSHKHISYTFAAIGTNEISHLNKRSLYLQESNYNTIVNKSSDYPVINIGSETFDKLIQNLTTTKPKMEQSIVTTVIKRKKPKTRLQKIIYKIKNDKQYSSTNCFFP